MPAEALVLVAEQHFEIARIDAVDARRQAPASVLCRESAQQAALAIDHQGGELHGFAERRRAEAIDPGGEDGDHCDKRKCERNGNKAPLAPLLPLQGEKAGMRGRLHKT